LPEQPFFQTTNQDLPPLRATPLEMGQMGLDSEDSAFMTQLPEGLEEALTIKPPVEMPDLSIDASPLGAAIERMQEVFNSITELKIAVPTTEELTLSLPDNIEEGLTLKMPSDQPMVQVDAGPLNAAIEALNTAMQEAANITHKHETTIDASGTINVLTDTSSIQGAVEPAIASLRMAILSEAENLISSKIAAAMHEIQKLIRIG